MGLVILKARSSTLAATLIGGWVDEAEERVRAPGVRPRSTAQRLITAALGGRTGS
jgi:hypothetical protein